MKIIICLAALLFLGLAQDITYTGTDSVWDKASNWSPANIPNATNRVRITSKTVDVSPNATFASLVATSSVINVKIALYSTATNITLISSTLNVYASLSGNGTIYVIGGAVNVYNNSIVNQFAIASGTVTINLYSGSFWSLQILGTTNINGSSAGTASVENFYLYGTLGDGNNIRNLTVKNFWWSTSTLNYNLWALGNTLIVDSDVKTVNDVAVYLEGPVWWTAGNINLVTSSLNIDGNFNCSNGTGTCNIVSDATSVVNVNANGIVDSTAVTGSSPQSFYLSNGILNAWGIFLGGIKLSNAGVLNLYNGTLLDNYPVTAPTLNILGNNVVIPHIKLIASAINIDGSGNWVRLLEGYGSVNALQQNVTIENIHDSGTLKFYGNPDVYFNIVTSAIFQSLVEFHNATMVFASTSQSNATNQIWFYEHSRLENFGTWSLLFKEVLLASDSAFLNFGVLNIATPGTFTFKSTDNALTKQILNAGRVFIKNPSTIVDLSTSPLILVTQCPSGIYYPSISNDGATISQLLINNNAQINGEVVLVFPSQSAYDTFNTTNNTLVYLRWPFLTDNFGYTIAIYGTFNVVVQIADQVQNTYNDCNDISDETFGYSYVYPANVNATSAQCVKLASPGVLNGLCPTGYPSPAPLPASDVAPQPEDVGTTPAPDNLNPSSNPPNNPPNNPPVNSPVNAPSSAMQLLVSVFIVVIAVITVF